MQNEPRKAVGNYNEFLSVRSPVYHVGNAVGIQIEEQRTPEQREIIETGLRLVHSKVDEILGPNNKLTRPDLTLPKIRFIPDAEHPWSGCFYADSNEVDIITSRIRGGPRGQTKVFIHEYFHFLSHNGFDDSEQASPDLPIARNNNVGFRRTFGLDVRDGKEGQTTGDYFLAFNEAVTEQLAIDILPGVHETYEDYRGLLNQVIDDAIAQKFGSNVGGVFQPWTRKQFKNYIYQCYFKGDVDGFTQFLKTVYKKYDISEQQFGLMTHRSDLPSVIESEWREERPDNPPPSPSEVARMVQKRLDNKTPDDYVTDIIYHEPESGGNDQIKYGAEYDNFVGENAIAYSHRETINGRVYDVDSYGYIIYRDEDASSIIDSVRTELDDLLVKLECREISTQYITEYMDKLLFKTYFMSMLSDGFRDFYIYKHTKLGSS